MKITKHKVLALKYRPKNFKELIGQDIMVNTIINSIKLNKLPNAYLLTGIRGTGKTTTARLIAKTINCKKNFIAEKVGDYCDCDNCEEISKDKHLDVLEMDAASRTGIDDVRELIESSKYNPTSARYKIYIIDEVHMLSKQAFNGLLKTLEEPPSHLKFIFATTEVKKIPVTIISRCQRFDLHRISTKDLVQNLKNISRLENGKISEEAITLIAKASEGSVRDSLSLLDRALVSQSIEKKEIDKVYVRQMLGITDRNKILNLLNFVFEGNQIKSLDQLKEMINEGIEPSNFLNDLLEIIYFIQQKKNIGSFDSTFSISDSEEEIIDSISKDVQISTLIVFWQLILKALEELTIVSNQILSLEMLIVRLIHVKDIPSYENLVNSFKEDNSKVIENENLTDNLNKGKKVILNEDIEIKKISKNQIKNTTQEKALLSAPDIKYYSEKTKLKKISSFKEMILLASKNKEMNLKYDLENNVNLIKFSEGKIDISFNQNLDKNFVRNLAEKLLEWTGNRWIITLSKKIGQKTFSQQRNKEKKELFVQEEKGLISKKFKDIFSDGKLLEVDVKEKK